MTSNLERPSVRRVIEALAAAGSDAQVIELAATARSAQDAAASLGCDLGAIVKSLVFTIGGAPVMALVAGDRRCDTGALRTELDLPGKVKRADADAVKRATGFSIGGVAPLAHQTPLPILVDESLRRFDPVYAAAGHPHCVFAIKLDDLVRVSGGRLSAAVSEAPG